MPRPTFASSARAGSPAPIRYRIFPADPEAHLFEVRCTVESPDPAGQRFVLPAWIPGSYMIREFARNIVQMRAESNSAAVALTKLDKDTWRADPCERALTVTYSVYAWDLSVRCAHLDARHGFFNGAAVFLRVQGQERVPHIVDIQRPRGAAYAEWRVATALPELKARRFGFGTYVATDYDELIDHPVEIGTFTRGNFSACGAEHDFAVTGRVPKLDFERLGRDLKTICQAQIRFFEPRLKRQSTAPPPPFLRYVFLILAVGDGYGGLEHRSSSALLCSRNDLPALGNSDPGDGYRNFLGLASHEYFHAWNVKRIKPAAFAPYDYQAENHTSLLWIFEGFTSYYDDLFLLRTHLLTLEQYLRRLEKTVFAVLRGSGRLKQSVAESSFDAWTKYYRQDENAANAIVSYYRKGALVALALDLHIRSESGGRKSLDDVMRALWEKYGRSFYPDNAAGLGENEFTAIIEATTGVDAGREVASWAYGTEDLPLAPLLSRFDIDFELKAEHERPTLGIKLAARTGSDAECRIASVHDGSAARAAGLSAGDVLVAIDGLRTTASNLDALLGRYAIGDSVPVHAFRHDELLEFSVTLGAEPPVRCVLSSRAGAKNKLFEAWLKGRR